MNVSDLIWYSRDGELRLSQLDDMHIRNAALKLIGFGTDEYEADDLLKARWLMALHWEWSKRMQARKANFSRTSGEKSHAAKAD
jgi:hypothetical protein